MTNSKFQVPGSKEATSLNSQTVERPVELRLGAWNFFGTWNLEIGISPLG
jgi:hypothetical protein